MQLGDIALFWIAGGVSSTGFGVLMFLPFFFILLVRYPIWAVGVYASIIGYIKTRRQGQNTRLIHLSWGLALTQIVITVVRAIT